VLKLEESWYEFAVPRPVIYNNVSLDQHHALKEVKKAAKKAKTFEIQKLIKKLKDLRSVRWTSFLFPIF